MNECDFMCNRFTIKHLSKAAGLLSVAAVCMLCACSKGGNERPAVPENTSLTDISGGINELSTGELYGNGKLEFTYSDYNYAESPSSQTGVLVGRCVRIKSFGKSDSGVVQLVVRNESDSDIKYALLKCTAGGQELSFKITSLLSGMTCVLSEDNGIMFDEKEAYYGFELNDRVDFDASPTLYPDKFTVYGCDNTIAVKNISDKRADNIYVYYKNAENGALIGNETYRVSIGSLAAGEEKQVSAEYFKAYTGRVLFIEYGD